MMTYKPSKLGQTDLVLIYDQSSLVGLHACLHKSLHIVPMICATLINTQTHRHTQLLTGCTITSASWLS